MNGEGINIKSKSNFSADTRNDKFYIKKPHVEVDF